MAGSSTGSGVGDIIDAYGGMISSSQAHALAGSIAHITDGKKGAQDITNVAALLELVGAQPAQKGSQLFPPGGKSSTYTVNIQDKIYRIFNPVTFTYNNRQQSRRTIVMGSEGYTIKFILKEKLSEFIDSNVFERGDIVIVKNASFDSVSGELLSMPGTMINKVMPAPESAIIDYSRLREGMKSIDIIGKIVELGPVRYVNRLGGGQVAVSDCTISNLEASVAVSLWGSSALATSRLSAGDFVKIEFCSTVFKNGAIGIYANELSRIVASKLFEGRLRPALR
ncbi:MAG: hypothetical protein QXW10_01970 [Candidatus Micrarchaeaceae archaeon]